MSAPRLAAGWRAIAWAERVFRPDVQQVPRAFLGSSGLECSGAGKESAMGEQKLVVETKLDPTDIAWIDTQVPVFGTRSAVLRLVVKVIRGLIAAGILNWDLPSLQALLCRDGMPAANADSEAQCGLPLQARRETRPAAASPKAGREVSSPPSRTGSSRHRVVAAGAVVSVRPWFASFSLQRQGVAFC